MSGRATNATILAVLLMVVGLIIGVVVCLMATPAPAHDSARPDLDKWFASLRNKNKYLCCDKQEAKETEYDMRGNHYWVPVNGVWMEVPDDAVVKGPNRDGAALLWLDGLDHIRCFMPSAGL